MRGPNSPASSSSNTLVAFLDSCGSAAICLTDYGGSYTVRICLRAVRRGHWDSPANSALPSWVLAGAEAVMQSDAAMVWRSPDCRIVVSGTVGIDSRRLRPPRELDTQTPASMMSERSLIIPEVSHVRHSNRDDI